MSENELLPCPFCGKPAILIMREDAVLGDSCDIMCLSEPMECFMSTGADWYLPRDDVIELWNKRKD